MEKPEVRKNLLVVLLSVCIALQCVTLIYLGFTVKRVAERPVYVSGGGDSFSFDYDRLRGSIPEALQADPRYYDDGKVIGIVQFDLMEKIPGSRVALRYRLNGEGKWQEVAMQQGEPLQYSARLLVSTSDRVEYQLLQTVQTEIVQASRVIQVSIAELVGSGDVSVYYRQEQGAKDITFMFESRAMVEALQIAEIRLEINKAKAQEIVLNAEPWTCTFDNDGLKGMAVTVTYKDGTVRTATYDFASQNPLIKR